jgi:hypothetical protein
MILKFFTHNNEDRIRFVEFVQNNSDVLAKLVDREEKELEVEGEKFKHPHNQKQKLADTLAFSKKRKAFKDVEATYNYFMSLNLGDDPIRGELLYDLDSDEIQNDGFMEHPERRRQIKEFEKWLNSVHVKKELAKKTLQKTIKKHHIKKLKENLDILSVRPMGALSRKDPGGLTYQRTLGKWEGRTMATHDKKGGKNKTKRRRKTRRFT